MDTFLDWRLPAYTLGNMTLCLVLAVFLGGLIGLERELNGHPAGLRTHILVCLGSTLITLVSGQIALMVGGRADPGRITAQIVSGIGFLGAGAIIREGASIRGLTTAASIWTTAAIGIAVGAGPRFGVLAMIATFIALFTLWGLQWLEDRIDRKGRRVMLLEVGVSDTKKATAMLLSRVSEQGVSILGIRCEPGTDKRVQMVVMRVRLPAHLDRTIFVAALADVENVHSVQME